MTAESGLWSWLSKARHQMDDLDIDRVENLLRASMPDVEGCWRGGQFWIELKSKERPARRTTPVRFKFQPGQSDWLERRWRLGGSVWLLCQVGSGAKAMRYLVSACHASAVEQGLTEKELADRSISFGRDAMASDVVKVVSHGANTVGEIGEKFFVRRPFTRALSPG